MAFDGNGNWIPEFSAKEDRDAGVKILASRFDDVFQQDLKESFEKCLTNDGQNRPVADFNFNNFKGINVADPIEDTDVVNLRTLNGVLSALYPVGSLYIGTQNTCPMSSLIAGSTWVLVAQDRALWGGNGTNGNTTIEAGLPNIEATWNSVYEGDNQGYKAGDSGAVSTSDEISGYNMEVPNSSGKGYVKRTFDASQSNSVYGNSTTVQPPAYRVNVWRRTS